MVILEQGHKYGLENFEMDATKEGSLQELQFIQKGNPDPNGSLNLIANGTTNEEVLRVLINRFQYLNAQIPCRENSIVITKLEEALMWVNKRTEDRKNRGVLQTDKQ